MPCAVAVRDVQELNERVSFMPDSIHDRGESRRVNRPKVMDECKIRPPIVNFAKFLVHRVV